MRKIILMMSLSVDGFFERQGRVRRHLAGQTQYVFSRTLASAAWNTTVIPVVVPGQIAELKARPGGDLVLGGADLAQAFLRLGLVDEYRIYIHPWWWGTGSGCSGRRTSPRTSRWSRPRVRQRGGPAPVPAGRGVAKQPRADGRYDGR